MSADALVSPAAPALIAPCSPLRLGVLASGSGTNFAALAAAIANGELPATLQVLIYNNPKALVAERAQQWQIPSVLLNHRHYNSRESLDAAIVETLKTYDVEWVVMAGWMRIVTPVLLNAYPQRVINLHPSLLPSFRGLHAVEQALAAGVKITGCTVHLVEEAVDSGPILVQAAVPVLAEDTPATLHARIQRQEHHILKQAIAHLAAAHSLSR
ncbi:phosphoribosylglycinamide formyltransferase [Synechococcus sp. PCC 6717]|jgi:phosphoribosylglycinamide formyltransferase-1|uniref:Phosphoribosylglycinamide formyltransferase n=1 Tax=Parathermosynechococcus lividus PCC 6715 TaxID=1917166 RepID=A0A2D2Q1Q1_PARLV|nr:phosphoribosylglycinamide formyltransferase [Thermostichus lividus]ATS18462.1 phosphoribosylglycinamide formyltransferase [Thermostichus lividus PCC 6715]MCH9054897.1 phosphoribosylglycinamide formyltransferase [Synechococcus sp. PCC 6716]MCI3279825.1 phosphoribosylglycinamide formyltransferase [Synechococcus sp. PCC 6717]